LNKSKKEDSKGRKKEGRKTDKNNNLSLKENDW